MKEMSMNELQELYNNLERGIKNLIEDFEEKTGLLIDILKIEDRSPGGSVELYISALLPKGGGR